MSAQSAPRGTKDVLPSTSYAWQWIHDIHRTVAESYGYRFIETPIFEHTELFERGVGAGTDVVEKEMYTFTDRGDRSLTLRPENTAGVMRAVLEAQLSQQFQPIRAHYAGPMFRYERPQKGRYRQHTQLGIECIGAKEAAVDVEVIEVAWEFYRRLGLTGITVHVNSLGDLGDRQRYREKLLAYYSPLREKLCPDCQRRLVTNPLRLLDCKKDHQYTENAPKIVDSLSMVSRDNFQTVLKLLETENIPVEIDFRLVRGLDYYGYTTFEFHHAALSGAQNALGGGGRYDGLAEVLGFASTPATGYALGVERILTVCEEANLGPNGILPCPVVVMTLGSEALPVGLNIAHQLRQSGHGTTLDAMERKLERKLREADRLQARVAVIIGDDEVKSGKAMIRDLASRAQEAVGQAEVIVSVDKILKNHE